MKNETETETRTPMVFSIAANEAGYAVECDEEWILKHSDVFARIISETLAYYREKTSAPATAPDTTASPSGQTERRSRRIP